MNQLSEKINDLEQTVKAAVRVIQELKSQQAILTKEKDRLTEELNQLKLREEAKALQMSARERSVEPGSGKINMELVKNELDQCIEQLASYIKEHSL